jgi:hypothetical protein
MTPTEPGTVYNWYPSGAAVARLHFLLEHLNSATVDVAAFAATPAEGPGRITACSGQVGPGQNGATFGQACRITLAEGPSQGSASFSLLPG